MQHEHRQGLEFAQVVAGFHEVAEDRDGPTLEGVVDAALSEKHRGRCRHGVEFTEGLLASTPGGSAGVPAAIGRNVDGAQECAV